ncbi:hypothetical protein B0H17DRAFT_1340271 [Mycena rosella]|uniref:Uncharacterized protein n=1 Tax=Mycena rosella TaxID=1033263 RepID=A0AAD7BM83_MYCRO|nr:hypothetical protein B0H17DRAFT_1340271 [Mycena rosella]
MASRLSLQVPPEICASICGEVEEPPGAIRTLLFRPGTLMQNLEGRSMPVVKSWCLAVTRQPRLAERVHALALLLPTNLEPADATKIGGALNRCVNLKELKISGEVYLTGRRPNSLNGWMINACPFRLTKFHNS